jgi:hypothetical protein
MSEPYKLFFVREHPRVSLRHQMGAARKFVAEDRNIWRFGRDMDNIDQFIAEIRPGDHVGVCHYWLFAPTGKRVKGKPSRELRRVTDAIFEAGGKVFEVDSGRSCADKAEMLAMYDDALVVLSGHRNQKGNPRGAPKKQVYSDDDKLVIQGVWHRTEGTNKDRVKAVQAMKNADGSPRFPHFNLAAWYKQINS